MAQNQMRSRNWSLQKMASKFVREGLKCLQRKEHYHLLRKYHNRMVSSFHKMQKLWEDYPGTGISQRIEIWNSWKTHKVKPRIAPRPAHTQSVDLQKEKPVTQAVQTAKPYRLIASRKKMVPREEDQVLSVGRAGPKGVLKVKAAAVHDDINQPPGKQDIRGSGLGPRGVLKVSRPKTNLLADVSISENLSAPEGINPISHQVTEMVTENSYREGDEGVTLDVHERKRKSKIAGSFHKKRPKEEETAVASIPKYKHLDVNNSPSMPLGRSENTEIREIKARKSKEEMVSIKGMHGGSGRPLAVEVGPVHAEAKQINLKEAAGLPFRAGELKPEAKSLKMKKNDNLGDEMAQMKQKRPKKGENVQNLVELSIVEPVNVKGKSEKRSKSVKSFDMDHKSIVNTKPVRDGVNEHSGHAEEQRFENKNRSIGLTQCFDQREPGGVKKHQCSKQKSEFRNKEGNFEAKTEKDYDFEMTVSGQASKPHGLPFVSSVGPLENSIPLRNKKLFSVKPENVALLNMETDASPPLQKFSEKGGFDSTMKSKKLFSPSVQPLASSLPFSARHLLSAIRVALLYAYEENGLDLYNHNQAAVLPSLGMQSLETLESTSTYEGGGAVILESDGRTERYSVPLSEILKRVERNPGDRKILETGKPLLGLVQGALKVLASKTGPAGVKGWKPLVNYNKDLKSWSWIGPLPGRRLQDSMDHQISAEAWGVSQKIILKLEEIFANWFKHGQESLQQLVSSPLPPPPPMPVPMDEKERFRELRAQKSLVTITPSSEDARAYFRMEELRRYSIPDRAFTYTAADGKKSIVAPLRRYGVKLNSKARDHFMLKPDRPSHVTILCLVRDAAARLPKSIGTRADVSALLRDSRFIMEDVSDAQVNQVVSGALDRLHYERDPCVRFDVERKLWVYLHADRQEEDFEDDGTSSTRRWKRRRKDAFDSSEATPAGYDQDSPYAMDEVLRENFIGQESSSLNGPDSGNPTALYSAGSAELVYSKSSSLSSPRVIRNGMNRSLVNNDSILFMEHPPVQSGYQSLQNGSPTVSWNSISR